MKRRISNDIVCLCVNNTFGTLVHNDERNGIFVLLGERGEEVELTVGQLRSIVGRNKKILEGFSLLITDVLDTDEYSVNDVINAIGIKRQYDALRSIIPNKLEDDSITIEDIENFIVKSKSDTFENKLVENKNSTLVYLIVSLSIDLFKRGLLQDYNKIRIIKDIVGDEEIFDDAEYTEIN